MGVGKGFASHEMVDHGIGEYVRYSKGGKPHAHSNTAENFFSIFKRGVYGVYHHVSEAHLHRYLAEFDFRHSNRTKLGINDTERATRAIQGATGKRLFYRPPHETTIQAHS